ncbi:MAG: hypothetical protein GXP62_06855, partial [Oligoflexia bacterium]|nr:hypothetical protein [Oligoflexia bacterium]
MRILVLAFCLGLSAHADDLPDVIEAVPRGRIDWTRLVLSVDARSELRMGAWKDRRIREQDALDRLKSRVPDLAQRVRVTPDTLAADLLAGKGDLPRRLGDAVNDWQIVETRYHDNGAVELVAELDLRQWLRPALRSLASQEATPPGPGDVTGLVVDARELPFEPCLAPRITAPTGTVFFGAQRLSADTLDLGAPVVFVTDPADPRAIARAGDHPLLVRAASVQGGGELVLDPTSARALDATPDLASIAAQGRVVIVVQ